MPVYRTEDHLLDKCFSRKSCCNNDKENNSTF